MTRVDHLGGDDVADHVLDMREIFFRFFQTRAGRGANVQPELARDDDGKKSCRSAG
jgi:hypothetical protein